MTVDLKYTFQPKKKFVFIYLPTNVSFSFFSFFNLFFFFFFFKFLTNSLAFFSQLCTFFKELLYGILFFQNNTKTQIILLVSTFSKLFSKLTSGVQKNRFLSAKLSPLNSIFYTNQVCRTRSLSKPSEPKRI